MLVRQTFFKQEKRGVVVDQLPATDEEDGSFAKYTLFLKDLTAFPSDASFQCDVPVGPDFAQAVTCFFEILLAGPGASDECKRAGAQASFLYGEDDDSVTLSQGCLAALFGLFDPGNLPAGKKLRARQFRFDANRQLTRFPLFT